MKQHSTATLMGMTKAELVEYVRMCEHNREVAEQTLKQHIENVKDWRPVQHGHWIDCEDDYSSYVRCSVCGDEFTCWEADCAKTDYCPNCGARMDGGADNGE